MYIITKKQNSKYVSPNGMRFWGLFFPVNQSCGNCACNVCQIKLWMIIELKKEKKKNKKEAVGTEIALSTRIARYINGNLIC